MFTKFLKLLLLFTKCNIGYMKYKTCDTRSFIIKKFILYLFLLDIIFYFLMKFKEKCWKLLRFVLSCRGGLVSLTISPQSTKFHPFRHFLQNLINFSFTAKKEKILINQFIYIFILETSFFLYMFQVKSGASSKL